VPETLISVALLVAIGGSFRWALPRAPRRPTATSGDDGDSFDVFAAVRPRADGVERLKDRRRDG
jgi:hypothetical protein